MANTYKNAAVVLTSTGATDLYTAPSNTRSLVQSVNIANVDSSNRYATVTWYDASAGSSYTLLYNGFIPAGTAMNALDTPCVLEPGDIIRVQASAANTLHATASIMEQDPTTPHVDGSITTVKIADDAVTADKLASSLSATTICTSGTRPASPFEGQKIYETDTDFEYIYDGSAWRVAWRDISFAAYGTNYQGSTNGFYNFILDLESFDNGSCYNTSTGAFVAPVDGVYFFSLNCRLDNTASAGYLRAYIYRSGTTQWAAPNLHCIFGAAHSTDYHSLSVSGLISLTAGQVVYAGGGHVSGASNLLRAESTFTGHWIKDN